MEPSNQFKGRQGASHNRYPFVLGLEEGILVRLSSVDEYDSSQVFHAGHGHDIQMNLQRDPQLAFTAVPHHIAEQVAGISAGHLVAKIATSRHHFQTELFHQIVEFHGYPRWLRKKPSPVFLRPVLTQW